ncbi:MAG TPA: type II toxin-antitoxin system PemK/MazF family toxin [Verrucomicrobiae bacterium]|nr:type II toxin-antitoxin system PemK/MazF family toxin [Verrucomicrobiae bacterium]
MKPFDIYSWQPAGWDRPHPCVVISHADRAARKDPVEVVMCSSQRATRQPEPSEIILDPADGLDWETLCKCDLIHTVKKSELKKPARERFGEPAAAVDPHPHRRARLVDGAGGVRR